MKVGSLFSGIGGLDLALEALGHEVIWFSEVEKRATEVLATHWPGVPNIGDITQVDWDTVERPDIIIGGFPCQDLSFAGKRAGIHGKRSGLWREYARAVRHLRPDYVIVENVPGLLTDGLGVVLGDLAEAGFDAEWTCLRASDVGAPHRRERVFVVAYARSERRREDPGATHGDEAGDGPQHDYELERARTLKVSATPTAITTSEQVRTSGLARQGSESTAPDAGGVGFGPGSEPDVVQVESQQSASRRADVGGCVGTASDPDGQRLQDGRPTRTHGCSLPPDRCNREREREMLLPTPSTRDRYIPRPGFHESSLPRTISELSGDATDQPSDDGKP